MKIKVAFSKCPFSVLVLASILLSITEAVDSRRVLVKGKELKLEMDGQVFKQLILNETDQDGEVERILLDKTSLETKSRLIPPISNITNDNNDNIENDNDTAKDENRNMELKDGRGIIPGREAENAGGDAQDADSKRLEELIGRVIRTRANQVTTTQATTTTPVTTTTTTTTIPTTTPPAPTTTAATTTTPTPTPTPIQPPPQSNTQNSTNQARGISSHGSQHSTSVSTTNSNSTQVKQCLSYGEFKDRIQQIMIQAKSTISLECPDQLPCQLWGSCSHLWPTGLITGKLSIDPVFLEHYFDTLHADIEPTLKKEWRTFIMGCCDYYRLFNDFEGMDEMLGGRIIGSESKTRDVKNEDGDENNREVKDEVITGTVPDAGGGNVDGVSLRRRKRDRNPSGDTTGLTDCRARLLDIQECVGYGIWKATCKRHKYDD